MSTQKLPQSKSLSGIIEDFIDKALSNTFCAMPGTIVTYDHSLSTAKVSVASKRITNDELGVLKNYPVLTDVPVFRLTGGTSGINMPIAKGDPCLIIFADRNIDSWFSTGSAQKPASRRMHSLSDGFAIVGFRPLTNPAKPPDFAATGIYEGMAQVSIKNGRAAITNASGDLKSLIDSLKSSIDSAFASATVTVTGPLPQTVSVDYTFSPPDFGGVLYTGENS